MSNTNFSLIYGKEPTNYIRRFDIEQKIISTFESDYPSTYSYIITGIRGSGKTVLLASISHYFKEKNDWIVLDINPTLNILEDIASQLYEKGKLKKLFLDKEFAFSFKGISFTISGKNPVSSVGMLLEKMFDYLNKKSIKVLINIDEVTKTSEIKTFAHTYQILLRNNMPIFLLMTGLYDNINKLKNEETLTFLYRTPKISLGPLSINLIADSYKKIFNLSIENSYKMALLTKGYAFAYQLLGYLFLNSDSKVLTDSLLNEYDSYLDEYAYSKIYLELTENERKFLSFIENDNDISVKDYLNITKMEEKTFSVYKDRLIKKGILNGEKRGIVSINLPRFYLFLSKRDFAL